MLGVCVQSFSTPQTWISSCFLVHVKGKLTGNCKRDILYLEFRMKTCTSPQKWTIFLVAGQYHLLWAFGNPFLIVNINIFLRFILFVRKQCDWWSTITAARRRWSGSTHSYHYRHCCQSSVKSVTLTPHMSSSWRIVSAVTSYSWTSLWLTWGSRNSTYMIRVWVNFTDLPMSHYI